VKGSNAGFDGIRGNPNMVVSSVNKTVKAGTKKQILIKLNKSYKNTKGNQKKIKVRAKGVRLKITRRNNVTAAARPVGNSRWPSKGRVKVTVKNNLEADDGDLIDSDYDGTQGGTNYRATVKIKGKKKKKKKK